MKLIKLINRTPLTFGSMLLLVGCVSSPQSIKPTDRVDSQQGILLASVTIDDARAVMDGWYFYRPKNSNTRKNRPVEHRLDAASAIIMSQASDDYPNNKSKNGRLLAIPIKAGDYELTNWTLYISQAGGYGYISPKKLPAPLPFTIQAGQITYLGNLHLNTITGKNFFGIVVPFGAYPVITNDEQVDLNLLKNKYPNLSNWPTHSALLDGSKWQIME